MRGVVRIRTFLIVAAFALSSAGCSMSWTEGWKLDRGKAVQGSPDVEALRLAARAADGKADSRAGVESLVKAWKGVLRAVPEDYEALWNLSSAYTLLGAGYARSIGEKGEFYRKALQHAERAMALDAGFRAKVEAGAPVWDAVEVLPAARVDAIGWWSTAVMRMFHECLSGVVQETNLKWIRRNNQVLARLQALDPSWGGSLILFDRAITATLLPPRAGGDRTRATALFGEAVTASPDWLRNRWGRARHLASAQKDQETLASDLQWVIAQDAKTAPGSYAWNAWFQRDAAEFLARPSDGF